MNGRLQRLHLPLHRMVLDVVLLLQQTLQLSLNLALQAVHLRLYGVHGRLDLRMYAVNRLRLHNLHGLLQRRQRLRHRLVLYRLLDGLLLDLRLQALQRVLHLRRHRLLLHRLYRLRLHRLLLYRLHRLLLDRLDGLLDRLLVHRRLQHETAVQTQ